MNIHKKLKRLENWERKNSVKIIIFQTIILVFVTLVILGVLNSL